MTATLSTVFEQALGLRAHANHVILQRHHAEPATDGGIALTDLTVARERPHRGTVLSVGPGKLLGNGVTVPIGTSVGDVVAYSRNRGTEFMVGGAEITIVNADDLLAVVSGENGDA